MGRPSGDHDVPGAFRPELAVRGGRRRRLRAALQGSRDEGGDEHRGGFSRLVRILLRVLCHKRGHGRARGKRTRGDVRGRGEAHAHAVRVVPERHRDGDLLARKCAQRKKVPHRRGDNGRDRGARAKRR
eukprot:16703-Pelagococcus_subviridis.AAC.1